MTADQRFALIIAGLGLVFAVMSAILGMIVTIVRKFTQSEDRLNELALNSERTQQATERRLRWLEEHVWRERRAGGS